MPDISIPSIPVNDKGVFSRTIGIIVSPGETFRTVVAFPRPAIMLLLVCFILGLAGGLPQFTERGRQAVLDMQIQRMKQFGQEMTPEVQARMEQGSKYSGYITMASIFVIIPVVSLLLAAVYWAVFNTILGGTGEFKQVVAIVTHSLVIAALGAVIAAPIQYIQGIQSVAGPFNLGALLPMLDPASFLARYLGAISVITLWQIIVSAIGLAVLYRRRSTGIAIALISTYLILAASVTAAFSSVAGR